MGPIRYPDMANLLMQIGDVIPFRNPLGPDANKLQPQTLNALRQKAAEGGLSTDMLKYIIAQQMQQGRK